MEFTYQGYRKLIDDLRFHGYQFCGFDQNNPFPCHTVIMRHDIDFSFEKACKLSEIEADAEIPSTWFVLLNTDFYNCCSQKNRDCMKYLLNNGGQIGLHFDESQYQAELQPLRSLSKDEYQNKLVALAESEAEILRQIIQAPVNSISYHCPDHETLASDIKFPSMVNAYSQKFFKQFKYVSDSSMNWREDIDSIVAEERFPCLQILTHAFWYSERYKDMTTHLIELCKSGLEDRQNALLDMYGEQFEKIFESVSGKELLR